MLHVRGAETRQTKHQRVRKERGVLSLCFLAYFFIFQKMLLAQCSSLTAH